MEKEAVVRCRQVDLDIVKEALPGAVAKYEELAKKKVK